MSRLICCGIVAFAGLAQSDSPQIARIFPAGGPEGSRVEITGRNLQDVSGVLVGTMKAVFKVQSAEEITVLIPHKVPTSAITVITPRGRAISPVAFVVVNDPRVPGEVSYKAGYVNSVPVPPDFHSAMLWGIAIADKRVSGYETAQVEVAWTLLSCRIDGKDVVLNDDRGSVRGGLYRREPWFGTDQHEPMPFATIMLIMTRLTQPWCSASDNSPAGSGISGARLPAPPCPPAISKGAPSKLA